MIESFATLPSFVCLGLIVLGVVAVLVAPPQYVRHSLVLTLIAVIGYAAVLVIMTIGTPTLTTTEQPEEAASSAGDAADDAASSSDGAAPADGY